MATTIQKNILGDETLIQLATPQDLEAILKLEYDAYMVIGSKSYPIEDLQLALKTYGGVSCGLISEGHYFKISFGREIIASGGWSSLTPAYEAHLAKGKVQKNHDVGHVGTVRSLYVRPDQSGKGYAKRIMLKIEQDALLEGVTQLSASCSKSSEGVLLSMGWTMGAAQIVTLPNGRTIALKDMTKDLLGKMS